jgi:hypothetical protein
VGFGRLDKAPAIVLLPAFFADAVDLKCVSSGDKVMFAANLLFELPYFGREKFNRGAALGTHHVVMASPIVLMFVARDSVVKGDFAGQPAVGEQLERPVDSRESDVSVFLLYQLVEFVGREVCASLEKRPENRAALFGLFQANPSEMPKEYAFRLANVLRRNGRLIVDSFLQHG